jgi:hypothetical protein
MCGIRVAVDPGPGMAEIADCVARSVGPPCPSERTRGIPETWTAAGRLALGSGSLHADCVLAEIPLTRREPRRRFGIRGRPRSCRAGTR